MGVGVGVGEGYCLSSCEVGRCGIYLTQLWTLKELITTRDTMDKIID